MGNIFESLFTLYGPKLEGFTWNNWQRSIYIQHEYFHQAYTCLQSKGNCLCVLQSWPKLIGQKKHNTGYNKIIWIYLPVNLGKEYSKWFYPILYIFSKMVSGFNFCHYLDGYFFYRQCNWNGFKTYIHSYLYC